MSCPPDQPAFVETTPAGRLSATRGTLTQSLMAKGPRAAALKRRYRTSASGNDKARCARAGNPFAVARMDRSCATAHDANVFRKMTPTCKRGCVETVSEPVDRASSARVRRVPMLRSRRYSDGRFAPGALQFHFQ